MTTNPNPAHKKNVLAGLSVPTSIDDPELRRFLHAVKQHLELSHGNKGQPKERYVTLDDLKRAGLADVKTVRGRGELVKLAETTGAAGSTTVVSGGDSDFPYNGHGRKQGNVLRFVASADQWRPLAFFDANDNVQLNDDRKIYLGTGSDFELYHDGTDLHVTEGTGDILLGASGEIYSAAADFHLGDDVSLLLGTDDDVNIQYDSANAYLYIAVADVLYDVSGRVSFPSSPVALGDGVQLYLGSDDDAFLRHDGLDLYLTENTGTIVIDANTGLDVTATVIDLNGEVQAATFNVGGGRTLDDSDVVALLDEDETVAGNWTLGSYVDLSDITAPSSPGSGTVRLWAEAEQGDHSFLHFTNTAGLDIELARDSVQIVRNDTGVTISAGSVVYVAGSVGNVAQVALAKADARSTMPAFGVAKEDIGDNSYGLVSVVGDVVGIDLSSFTEGDELYVSDSTAGALTATEPSNPSFRQHVGTVLKDTAAGVLSVSIRLPVGRYIETDSDETISGAWTFTSAGATESDAAIQLISATPYTYFRDTAAAADEGAWIWGASSAGFLLQTLTDAGAFGATALEITRTGTNVDEIGLDADLLDLNGAAVARKEGSGFDGLGGFGFLVAPASGNYATFGARGNGGSIWSFTADATTISGYDFYARARPNAGGAGALWLGVAGDDTGIDELDITAALIDLHGDVTIDEVLTLEQAGGTKATSALVLQSAQPTIYFHENDSGTNRGRYRLTVVSDQFRGSVLNDAETGITNWVEVDASGAGPDVDAVTFPASPVIFNQSGLRDSAAIQVIVSSGHADIYLKNGANATDEKAWNITAPDSASGLFRVATAADDDSFGENALEITRTGTSVSLANFPNSPLAWGGGAAIASSDDVLADPLTLPNTVADTLSTGNNNNWNPGISGATRVRVTGGGSGSSVITGLQGGSDGKLVILTNVGNDAWTVAHQNANSSAANRFACNGNTAVGAGVSITFIYDGSINRWSRLDAD